MSNGVKGKKVSELDERLFVDGDEYIPVSFGARNYKVKVRNLQFVSQSDLDQLNILKDKLIGLLENTFLRKDKEDRTPFKLSSDTSFEVGKFVSGESGAIVYRDSLGQTVGELDMLTVRRLLQSDEFFVKQLIQSMNFSSGSLGSGFSLSVDGVTGLSKLEIDDLFVRRVAYFVELVIKRLSHVGGEIILSPASMTCSKVEEYPDFYRCYFLQNDGNRSIVQEFEVGDQARSQTFNIKEGTSSNARNQFYWRLVTGVGEDYIDLSKTDCAAGSTAPLEGDYIVQLGNRIKAERQNAQVLSSYGSDAPSYKQYQGIDSYSLDGKEMAKISPSGNRIVGDFVLTTGVDVLTQFNVMEGKISSEVSSVRKELYDRDNILSNASLTVDSLGWETEQLTTSYKVDEKYLLFFGKPYIWKRSVVGVSLFNGSNSLRIKNGSIIQLNENLAEHPTFSETEKVVTDSNGVPVLDASGNKTYKTVTEARVFTLEFFYQCVESGTLTVGFNNIDGTGFEPFTPISESIVLDKNTMFAKRTIAGYWNGTGDFFLSFTGDIYIRNLVFTDDRLADVEHRFSTRFEQTDKQITLYAEAIKKNENTIEEKYSELKVSADEISAKVSANTTAINDVSTTVSENYSELSQTAEEISATVSSNYKETTDKIGELTTYTEEKVASLTLTSEGLTTEVKSVKGTVDGISGDLETLEENYSTLKQTAESISAAVSSNKEEANKAIAALNTSIGNLDEGLTETEKSIADANGTITTINENLGSLGNRVAGIEGRESGYATTTALKQTNDAITAQAAKWDDLGTLVSAAGFLTTADAASIYAAKGSIISVINVSPESITIDSSKINFVGVSTFTTAEDKTNSVWIDGAEIFVYSSSASSFAKLTSSELWISTGGILTTIDSGNITLQNSTNFIVDLIPKEINFVQSVLGLAATFGILDNGCLLIQGEKWATSASEVPVNGVYVDGTTLKVRAS